MLSEVELIKNKPNRFVLIKGSGAGAYVNMSDPERNIYIEKSTLSSGFSEEALWALGHELTHLNSVFNSGDFWYFGPQDDPALNSPPFDMVRRPEKILSGEVTEENFVNSFGLLWQTGAISLAGAVEVFNKSPEVRTRLALHNADTLINFASSLANARVMRDQFKRT